MPTPDLRQTALKLLARREHSQFELKRKLKLKGFSSTEIQSQLDLLKEAGLQSDARFTEAYINERIRADYGPRAIRMMLGERGIGEALIDQFISVYSNVFWRDQLQLLWRKKFGAKQGSQQAPKSNDSLAEKAKQYRFLSYRGFEPEAIYALFKQKGEIRRAGASLTDGLQNGSTD